MVGSLSSGSSGPRPVISSRISETKSLEFLCVESAGAPPAHIAMTSCCTCRRISSSGSLSRAERLMSSIRRAMQTHLGVEQLVAKQRTFRLLAATDPARCLTSGKTVQDPPSSSDDGGSSGAGKSGVAARRAVEIGHALADCLPRSPCKRELKFFQVAAPTGRRWPISTPVTPSTIS